LTRLPKSIPSPESLRFYNNAPKSIPIAAIIPPAPTFKSLLALFVPVAPLAVELAVSLLVLTAPASLVVCDPEPEDVVVAAAPSEEAGRETAVDGFGAEV
jgi:hypothetical protein